MHNQLEAYLAQIERQLAPLPTEQRDAELREIRLHLQMMVEDYIAIGDTPDEATAAALRQFGSARKLGRELQHVRSADRLRRVRPLLAGAATYGVYATVCPTFGWFMDCFGDWMPRSLCGPLADDIALIGTGFIAGWVAETIAPREAIWSVVATQLLILTMIQQKGNDYEVILSFALAGLMACLGTWARQQRRQQHERSSLVVSS